MNTTLNALMIGLMLLLPLSALAARRLPAGSLVRMVLAWVAIFTVIVVAVLAWQSFTAGGEDPGDAPIRTDVAALSIDPKLT